MMTQHELGASPKSSRSPRALPSLQVLEEVTTLRKAGKYSDPRTESDTKGTLTDAPFKSAARQGNILKSR